MQLDKHTFVYREDPLTIPYKTGYQFIMEKFNGDKMTEKLVANTIVYDSLKRVWTIKNYTDRHINGLKETMVMAWRDKRYGAGYAPGGF